MWTLYIFKNKIHEEELLVQDGGAGNTELTFSHEHIKFTPTDRAVSPEEEPRADWTVFAQQTRVTTQKKLVEKLER